MLSPEPSLRTAACLASPLPESPLPEGQDWKCTEIRASWAPDDSAVLVHYQHQKSQKAAAGGHDDNDAYFDDDEEEDANDDDDAEDDAEGELELASNDPPQHAQVGQMKVEHLRRVGGDEQDVWAAMKLMMTA